MDLVRSQDGVIHAINPLQPDEFTLCGDAFDGDDSYVESKWESVISNKVTCKKCKTVIRYIQELEKRIKQ